MKKTLLSILTFIGFVATAQTLTYANSAPSWGDVPFQISQCDSTGIAPGASGAGVVWSYAPTNLHSLKTYTTSNTMPGNADYPSANVSVYSSTANVSYYHSDPNNLKYYGGNLSISGNDLKLIFSNPAIVATYPMSLNSSITSTTSGTVVSILTGTFSGSCNVIADASGTLTLPAKTFTNTLRVVTSQTLSAPALFGTLLYLKVYDYYRTDDTIKSPIFSIQTSTISSTFGGTSTQTIVLVQPNYNVVGLNSISKSNIQLSVFPNPASNFINFSTASIEATKVLAIDMTGKIIATEMLEMGKAKMNTSNLASGVYLYQVTDKNNQILTSGKFNIGR